MPNQGIDQIMEKAKRAKRELNEKIKEFDVPLCQIINKLGLINKNSEPLGEKDLYLALNRKLREMEKNFEEALISNSGSLSEIPKESQEKLSNESLHILLLRNMIMKWFSDLDKQAEFSEKLRKLIDSKNESKQSEGKPDISILDTVIDDKVKVTFKNFGIHDQTQFNGIQGYVPGYFEENGKYQEGYYKFYVPQLNEFIKIFESELCDLRVPIVGNKNFADFGNTKYGGNCYFNSLISVMIRRPSFYMFLQKLADRIFKPDNYKFESDFENMFHVLKDGDIYSKFKKQCPTLTALADYVKILDEAQKNEVTYVVPRYLRKHLEDINSVFKQCVAGDPNCAFFTLVGKVLNEMEPEENLLYSQFKLENDFMSFDFFNNDLVNCFFHGAEIETFCCDETKKLSYKAMINTKPSLDANVTWVNNEIKKLNTGSKKETLNLADIFCCFNNKCKKVEDSFLIGDGRNAWLENGTGIQIFLDRGSNKKGTFKKCNLALPSLIKNGNNYFMLDGVVTYVPPNHFISVVRDKENTFYEVNDSNVSKVDASVLTRDPVVSNGYLLFYRRITENVFDLEKSYGATVEDLTDPENIDNGKYFLPLLLHESYDGLKKFLCDIGLVDGKTNSFLKDGKSVDYKTNDVQKNTKQNPDTEPKPATEQTILKPEVNEIKNDQQTNKSKEDIKKDEIETKDKPQPKSKKKIFSGSKGLYIFLCIITFGIFYFFRKPPENQKTNSKDDQNKNQSQKGNEDKQTTLLKSDEKTRRPLSNLKSNFEPVIKNVVNQSESDLKTKKLNEREK